MKKEYSAPQIELIETQPLLDNNGAPISASGSHGDSTWDDDRPPTGPINSSTSSPAKEMTVRYQNFSAWDNMDIQEPKLWQ